MKQYLLGIAAIVLAAGLSAFTSSERTQGDKVQDTYWFAVDQRDITAGTVSQSDVTFIEKNSGSTPLLTCNGTQTYYCLINFTDPDKVIEMPEQSGEYEIVNSQLPDHIASKRQ